MDFGDKSVDLSVASRVNKINTLLHGKEPNDLWCNAPLADVVLPESV